jgi:peroxiredoxin
MRGVILWIILLGLITSGCLARADTGGNTTAYAALEPGVISEPAPDFTLEALTGETVTLSDLRGQWVVINFWATWCLPCVKEMPYLQKMAAERDMVVLGVNFNEAPETVAQFVAEHNLSFPILMNPDDITLLVYQVRGLPRTFIIAPDGTIALRIVGEVDPDQLDRWLDDHLAVARY